jgi:hypothetical protein
MKPLVFACALASVSASLFGANSPTLHDARNWAHSFLLDSDTTDFHERLIWADSIFASQPSEAAMTYPDLLHLFPSFAPADNGPVSKLEWELLWFVKSFEIQNKEAVEQHDASPLPTPPTIEHAGTSGFIQQRPWMTWGMAMVALAMAILSIAARRKRKDAPTIELSADLEQCWHQVAEHANPATCRLQLIQLAFEQGRHPVQLAAHPKNPLWDLSASELMLAALLHDQIGMNDIETALEKSRGTLYNMRSQLRKKMDVREEEDLTTALRKLCKS